MKSCWSLPLDMPSSTLRASGAMACTQTKGGRLIEATRVARSTCRLCRATAAGTLGQDNLSNTMHHAPECSAAIMQPPKRSHPPPTTANNAQAELAGRAAPLTMQVASVCRLDRQVSEGTSHRRRFPSRDRESSRRGAALVAASSTTSLAWPRSRWITRASTTLITAGISGQGRPVVLRLVRDLLQCACLENE